MMTGLEAWKEIEAIFLPTRAEIKRKRVLIRKWRAGGCKIRCVPHTPPMPAGDVPS